ncbi:hypothetical protein FS837_004324 [Tulasnella sp. UAMH 9824]|nr:hypothetical protein FS837_004324 [Tulasnella sp. UAMH 9824]
MHETTSTTAFDEIYRSFLASLQEETQRNPQLGAASVISNYSGTPLCSVQDLDEFISSVEQSLEEAYLRLTSHVAAAKRRRNALLPISKLPTEILGGILELTCDLEPGEECSTGQKLSHIEYLLTLTAVSSQFLSVAMATPTLWTVADGRCSPSQVKKCLERSRGRLITVKYSSIYGPKSDRTIVPTWWFDTLISEHIARWRDAELVVDSEELESLCELAAPQLRRIVIKHLYETHGKPVHLFRGNAPKLRVIDLTGIHSHWEWDRSMIMNLRSIALRDVLISRASVGSFLSVIQSSLMLEKLVIFKLQLEGAVDLTPVFPSWLYSLKELGITMVSYDVLGYFLGTIRAPNIQTVAVDPPCPWNTEEWGQLLLGCLDNSILQHINQAQHIELSFDHRAVQICLSLAEGPPVLFGLDGQSARLGVVAVDWVLENILVYRKRSTFSVRFASYIEVYIRDILPSLLRLQDVTGLELDLDVPPGCSPDPWFLSCPVSGAGGKQWLWPRLTTVTVRGQGWDGVGDYILPIVKSRLEASSASCDWKPTRECGKGGRPALIHSVWIKDLSWLSKSTATQLKNLVSNIELPSPEQLIVPVADTEPLTAYNFVEQGGASKPSS